MTPPPALALLLSALCCLGMVAALLLLRRAVAREAEVRHRAQGQLAEVQRAVEAAEAGRRAAEAEAAQLRGRLTEEAARATEAQRQEAEAQRERARWQRAALGPYLLSQALPVYPERPCLLELDALVGRLRGAAFVDTVAVADAAGLLLCRDETEEARRLAALVPLLCRFGDEALGGAGLWAATLLTEGGRYVSARPLPPPMRGAWLLTLSTGRPTAPLALDVAVAGAYAYAALDTEEEQAPSPAAPLRGARGPVGGTGEGSLAVELERAVQASGALGLLVHDAGEAGAAPEAGAGGVRGGYLRDGPTPAVCARLGRGLEGLRAQGAWLLKGGDLMRLEVLCGEVALTYAPLAPQGAQALLALCAGLPLDELHLEALRGRLLRLGAQRGMAERDRDTRVGRRGAR
jgi:hypothetical protein